MNIIVQKYGGTSVGSLDKLKFVATKIKERKKIDENIVVVVSAMAGETNKIVKNFESIDTFYDLREADLALSTGEQLSVSLLSNLLNREGCGAISLLGFQAGILTNGNHGNAMILGINPTRIFRELKAGKVVIIAGFQGADSEGNITTLGRGGSDLSAVAIAAAINATQCEIYTDVEGVFTADPGLCKTARRIEVLTHSEMLELANYGAKVLQHRSVEFARKFNVPIAVRSTFLESAGTMVVSAVPEDKRADKILGITCKNNLRSLTINNIQKDISIDFEIFRLLEKYEIGIDMVIKGNQDDTRNDLTLTILETYANQAYDILRNSEITKHCSIDLVNEVSKISVIGTKITDHSKIATKIFEIFGELGVEMKFLTSSDIKVSCLVDRKDTPLIVNALHDHFIFEEH